MSEEHTQQARLHGTVSRVQSASKPGKDAYGPGRGPAPIPSQQGAQPKCREA